MNAIIREIDHHQPSCQIVRTEFGLMISWWTKWIGGDFDNTTKKRNTPPCLAISWVDTINCNMFYNTSYSYFHSYYSRMNSGYILGWIYQLQCLSIYWRRNRKKLNIKSWNIKYSKNINQITKNLMAYITSKKTGNVTVPEEMIDNCAI